MLGAMAALGAAVVPTDPARSVALGGVTLVIFVLVTGTFTSVLSTALWVIVALLVGHVLANRRAYVAAIETQVRLAEQTREEHARRLLAEERLGIARELHDLLAHTISVINVQAGVASHVVDERPDQAREALMVIKTTSKEALQEMRGMLGVLRQSDEPESRTPAPGLNHLDTLIKGPSGQVCRRASRRTVSRTTSPRR